MTLYRKISDSPHPFLSICALALLFFVLGFIFFTDPISKIIIATISLVVIIFSYRISRPEIAYRASIVRTVIISFSAFASGVIGIKSFAPNAMIAIASSLGLNWVHDFFQMQPDFMADVLTISICFMFFTLCIVTVFMTSTRSSSGYLQDRALLRKTEYTNGIKTLALILRSNLERVDEELRWDHRLYVELDAEVDIIRSGIPRRRVENLLKAINKQRRWNLFLILGVPGSGKSVALRRLCIDLLNDFRPERKLPIYVNLKEWTTNRQWTVDKPPTSAEFVSFLTQNIRNRLPDPSRPFFDRYFSQLLDQGDLFFLFDSFDEIPGILDQDETSILLAKTSQVIIDFLLGTSQSRGVIASRYYRKPNLGRREHITLEIRPFSEFQISRAISSHASRSDQLQRILFQDRKELGAIGRFDELRCSVGLR